MFKTPQQKLEEDKFEANDRRRVALQWIDLHIRVTKPSGQTKIYLDNGYGYYELKRLTREDWVFIIQEMTDKGYEVSLIAPPRRFGIFKQWPYLLIKWAI